MRDARICEKEAGELGNEGLSSSIKKAKQKTRESVAIRFTGGNDFKDCLHWIFKEREAKNMPRRLKKKPKGPKVGGFEVSLTLSQTNLDKRENRN